LAELLNIYQSAKVEAQLRGVLLAGTQFTCFTSTKARILTLYWYKSTNTDAVEAQLRGVLLLAGTKFT
jgi:hypothetical protein